VLSCVSTETNFGLYVCKNRECPKMIQELDLAGAPIYPFKVNAKQYWFIDGTRSASCVQTSSILDENGHFVCESGSPLLGVRHPSCPRELIGTSVDYKSW